MPHQVYLALGSNLGDRVANLRAALSGLKPEVEVLELSPVYETAPWGYTRQPAFLNQVVKAETDLKPEELLVYLKQIEVNLGRISTFRNGPRQIDLDILFYDDLILENTKLTIPHPSLAERAFVLVPLARLAPCLVHPVNGKTVEELLSKVDTSGVEEYSA